MRGRDAGPAQYGVSAPYYINNRWQRQPAESLSVGRIFRIKEKYQLQIRAEFQNVFNRVFYSAPSTGNGTGTTSAPATSQPLPGSGFDQRSVVGRLRLRQSSFNGAEYTAAHRDSW